MTDFNKMANDGYDPAFFRAAETMRAFGEGPFYAIEMIQAFLNTQGGARRNARAEVVGTDGEPIPHLYSAGEFGGGGHKAAAGFTIHDDLRGAVETVARRLGIESPTLPEERL